MTVGIDVSSGVFELCVVLYGAVEHWLSGALVNVGDMI